MCDEAQEQQRVDGAAERRGRLRDMHREADVSRRKACLGGHLLQVQLFKAGAGALDERVPVATTGVAGGSGKRGWGWTIWEGAICSRA